MSMRKAQPNSPTPSNIPPAPTPKMKPATPRGDEPSAASPSRTPSTLPEPLPTPSEPPLNPQQQKNQRIAFEAETIGTRYYPAMMHSALRVPCVGLTEAYCEYLAQLLE